MNIIYYWIGFAVVWLSVVTALFFILAFFYELIINWIAARFKSLWVIYEFQFYKNDFKEWVKTKERHKNMQ
jgi:hypothetical protein